MLSTVSDEALPLIVKKNVRVNVNYIKRHWIGLDKKEKKKRYKLIIIIIVTIIQIIIIITIIILTKIK